LALNKAFASQERVDTSQNAKENKNQPTRKDESPPRPAPHQKGKKTKLDTENPRQDKQKTAQIRSGFYFKKSLF
jgi:hypothetical protein